MYIYGKNVTKETIQEKKEKIYKAYVSKTNRNKEIINLLRQRSRPYLFSNTLAPAIVGASIELFDMLKESNARIFNTVACWGGRYIKYKREQSMLLSAMYGGGVLLYSGSCVPAMGKCGHFHHDETWRIQPAAYSETFMGRFAEYECLGTMTAGEAFLKAKCDYYNTSRQIEEDEVTYALVQTLRLLLTFKKKMVPSLSVCPSVR